LAAIDGGSLLGPLAPIDPERAAVWKVEMAEPDALARKALRTLYFTAMFNDLPEKNQRHPEMQKRMQKQLPEIDDAIFGMAAYLDSQSKEDLDELQQILKKNRDTGAKISEAINKEAKRIGVPLARRAQIRTMATYGAWRMQAQPPSLLVEEYVGKVKKVAAKHGQAEALKRYLATSMGDRAFWKHQRKLAQVVPHPAPEPMQATPLQPEVKRPSPSPGGGVLNAGAVLMGITVVLGAWGGVMVGTLASLSGGWLVGAVMLTHGVLTLVAGLVCLIVGAAKNANATR
jgi:hypothetical protein